MSKILIKNGKVFNGNTFINADVLTENKEILKIEEGISDKADFIYDAKNCYVSSGFIDIHSHILGISSDNFGTPADSSFFPFGVTTAVDGGAIKGNGEILNSFKMKTGVFVPCFVKDNKVCFEQTENLLSRFGKSVIGIKAYMDENVSNIKDVISLQKAVEFADKKELPLMVHCSNTPVSMEKIVDVLRCGDILTHAYHGGKNNCLENNFASLKKAKQKGVIIDTGMAGHIHTNFNNLKKAIKEGCAPDTLGTDITKLSAFIRGGKYGTTLCMSILRECGMSDTQIFKTVTVNAGKAIAKNVGELRIGGIADIAVTDITDMPFEFNYNKENILKGTQTFECKLTVCDGIVVYRK